jgi:probable phosphoglycerate mutase
MIFFTMHIQHELFIARHGNTFDAGDIVRRVGKRTDLPLSLSGQAQAQQLAAYMRAHVPSLQQLFCSSLKRTQQTAHAIQLAFAPQRLPLTIRTAFDEIDYGPDENQPEAQVIARLGQSALNAWDEQHLIPDGWQVDLPALRASWQQFSHEMRQHPAPQTWLVVTSQGIARFAETLLNTPLPARKLTTGALCHLRYQQDQWQLISWNVQPVV